MTRDELLTNLRELTRDLRAQWGEPRKEHGWLSDKSLPLLDEAIRVIEAHDSETAKLARQIELISGQRDRYLPCPDHRDKAVAGTCYMCVAERASTLRGYQVQFGNEAKAECDAFRDHLRIPRSHPFPITDVAGALATLGSSDSAASNEGAKQEAPVLEQLAPAQWGTL
jgi:hypothetical protein